ncbi:MAG: TonB-dependent receptor plug domain-containing protein, partial [Pseudomonadota bacterium]
GLPQGPRPKRRAPRSSQEPYREAPSRQVDDIQEDDIIVTGTRFETPLDQIGRSVDVIGAADIARRQQRFLIDALQAAPGIQPIRSGSFGAQSSLSVRGLPSAQTLVVQDGIVLNNPSSFGNAFNFATFDASDIERIEVLRGAQSTLYGSSAIGGVINIVTRDGADGFGGSAFAEGGSFGTFRGAASLRGGTARASARATISGVTTGGFSSADEANGATEEDGFNNLTVSTRARAALSDVFSVEGVIRYQDSRTEFDGFDFSTGSPTDANNIADMEELAVAGVAAARLFGGAWENRLTVAYLTNDQFNSGDAFPFDATGERLSYEYQGAVKAFERAVFIYGVEYEEQTSDVRAGFGASAAIDTMSGYGLLQLKPVDGVTLNAGIRHDANDGLDGVAITRDTTLNGAGAIAIPNTGVTLRGSYSEG